ncbi:MAG: response regulator [Eubacteriales bacterium]|nr:response regulator [Eubacteriales bacterium]
MYKILFVDDEKSVLEYLPIAIDWKELGITQIYTANDAKTALRIVREEEPDIAVIDVEMPGKNGLEFCKEAQAIRPQIKFVILSAFDRFDYARKGIILGVNDYLLKPVDEAELMAVMKKIVTGLSREELSSRQKQSMQIRALEKEAGELFRDLFHGRISEQRLEEVFPFLEEYEHICMVMQGNTDGEGCGEYLKEALDGEYLLIEPETGFYAVMWKRNIQVSIEQRIEECRQAVKMKGFHLWFAYVRKKREEGTAQALTRCVYVLESVFYGKQQERLLRDSMEFGQTEPVQPELEEGLRILSEEGDISALQSEIYKAIRDAFDKREEPVRICGMILDVFIALKMYLTKYWQKEAMDVFRKIDVSVLLRCGTPEKLYTLTDQYLGELQIFVREHQKSHGNFYIVKMARDYTKEHYQDKNLSLQEVADAVGISRTYFSKTFKELTGEKYWDYLSEYRIQKAKELLSQTNLGQAEISERVGYASEFHFSRKFKEIVGMSPNKYRRK